MKNNNADAYFVSLWRRDQLPNSMYHVMDVHLDVYYLKKGYRMSCLNMYIKSLYILHVSVCNGLLLRSCTGRIASLAWVVLCKRFTNAGTKEDPQITWKMRHYTDHLAFTCTQSTGVAEVSKPCVHTSWSLEPDEEQCSCVVLVCTAMEV
jgi:hypothetical protein